MFLRKKNLRLAVEEVMRGKTFAAAERKHLIPESTIIAHCEGNYAHKNRRLSTILSKEEVSLVK